MTDEDFDTDVLIVGAGPTGATAALALAKQGVRVRVVTRTNWLANSPRAHITNQRTNEVFRDLGLSADIKKFAMPWREMGDSMFTTSVAGPELMRIRAWGTGEDRIGDYLRASPCEMVDIIQPDVEPILVGHAAQHGARFEFNTEYVAHEQDRASVTVLLREVDTGREYRVRAKHMIAADGARSKIVEDLGIPFEGKMGRAATVYAMFQADLTQYFAHRPSVLTWIVTPHASFGEIGMGILRAVKPWTEWIAGWGVDLDVGAQPPGEKEVGEKISIMLGDPSIPFKTGRISVWYVNQAVATTYSSGRVFCAGDAVHRHPPSNGLGLNTCVQDAYNLAWKLAYVVKGYAGDALLDSYSAERVPVGRQIVERANRSRLDYAPLQAALRVEGARNPIEAGIARLGDPGPDGVAARAAAMAALELKQKEFNAHGVEMNQRYSSGAVIADDAKPESWSRDPELYAQTTTRPGAKLPHVWLIDETGRRCSTLDLVGKGQFTLLTGLAGQVWSDAVLELGLPILKAVIIGSNRVRDVYFGWQKVREIEEAGALLVRPDGVVAWRHAVGVDGKDMACNLLKTALQSVLGHSGGALDMGASETRLSV